ncbi:MAG: c-type cytochrome [Aeromonas sp.]
MSSSFSLFITLVTLGTIAACAALLWWCLKDDMGVPEGESMGHSFDGIEELNHPLPRWWSFLFIFLIITGLLYLLAYPGLGNWRGLLGWQSSHQAVHSASDIAAAKALAAKTGAINAYDREMAQAKTQFDATFRPLVYQADGSLKPIALIASNEQATQIGQRLYLQNCAQCHGADARGGRGFPNLTDSEWQWGGAPEQIHASIAQGRQGVMAAWGEILGAVGVQEVASYALSLSGRKVDDVEAQKGAARFALCAACHGVDGKGNIALGAPDLTNNIWLYGGSRQAVVETITHGRHGVMPGWLDLLGAEKVQLLSAYVYSLRAPATTPTAGTVMP